MNRLFLLLAASALGTGCVVSDDHPGDVVLYWDFARHAPAQASGFVYYDQGTPAPGTHKCAESDVDTVRVSGPVVGSEDIDCVFAGVQGVTALGVPGGRHEFRLQGLRSGTVVYDSTVAVIVDGGRTVSVSIEGVPAALDMFGDLQSGSTLYANCAEALSPNVAYQVADVFGNTIDGATVGCSDPLPSPVFSGDLDLDDYFVRMKGLSLSNGSVVLDSCWQPLTHMSAQIGDSGGFTATLLTNPIPVCTSPFM